MTTKNPTRNQRRRAKKAMRYAELHGCRACKRPFAPGEAEVHIQLSGRDALVHHTCVPRGATVFGCATSWQDTDPYIEDDRLWFASHPGVSERVRPVKDRNELVMLHKMQLLAETRAYGEATDASSRTFGMLAPYDEDPGSVQMMVVQLVPGQRVRQPILTTEVGSVELLLPVPGFRGAQMMTREEHDEILMDAQLMEVSELTSLGRGDEGASVLARAAAFGQSRNATKH
jgi:hypothetical protein